LRTLFIILLIYLLLKYLGRILAPILLKRFANKMQDRFKGQFNQQYENPQKPVQPEGKVTLEKTKPSAQKKSDVVGDYVDFEEVEE
jgi:ribosomal protein S17E